MSWLIHKFDTQGKLTYNVGYFHPKTHDFVSIYVFVTLYEATRTVHILNGGGNMPPLSAQD